ncbi:hypothetical protein RclHR1_01080004 [Rhizophagus clarus]|uniref:Uncharacterized protein n=1 Tax=Rhizophagus clarus TaxID=94130 RepID=A0A2Z6QTW7_9GLOM|nr:hypothetical protein RclHR1_01080004 [Rhizophagus clarus]
MPHVLRKWLGTLIDEKEAFNLYQKAADLGNSNRINNLGQCHSYSIGTEADLGNVYGISSLGDCYYNGIGTYFSKQKAFESYLMAANLDDDYAQYNVANMYKIGDGVKKDLNLAIYWYNKSAGQGYLVAQNKLYELS